MDGQLRDGAVDWADETLEAAALDRLGQLLLAQPRLALGLGELGEDARARPAGGLPRIPTTPPAPRLPPAGGGEAGLAIARGGETPPANLGPPQLRDTALPHNTPVSPAPLLD